jgi:hypothetical protein
VRVYTPLPLPANDFLETDMTDQIYRPHPSDSTRAQATQPQDMAPDEWKAQLDRLLDEYRNHYVLLPGSGENPRP